MRKKPAFEKRHDLKRKFDGPRVKKSFCLGRTVRHRWRGTDTGTRITFAKMAAASLLPSCGRTVPLSRLFIGGRSWGAGFTWLFRQNARPSTDGE